MDGSEIVPFPGGREGKAGEANTLSVFTSAKPEQREDRAKGQGAQTILRPTFGRSRCTLPKSSKFAAKRDADWLSQRAISRASMSAAERGAYVQRMAPQVAEMALGAAGIDALSSLICIRRAGDFARDLLALCEGAPA